MSTEEVSDILAADGNDGWYWSMHYLFACIRLTVRQQSRNAVTGKPSPRT